MSRNIILFELNEVPWRVISDFVEEHPETTLAKILANCRRYETFSDDGNLNPWVTWPTVHRGINDRAHEISNFGQDLAEVNKEYPAVWDTLSRHGVPTGVFGSFHTYPPPDNLDDYLFYVPDVFAAGSECFPKRLEAFQDFNLSMSRQSGRNVSSSVPLGKAARFLMNMPSLGLKFSTMADVGKQLVDERRENWKKIRRRTYQVIIAFDIFMKQLKRRKPAFSTFFTNHVASSMHRFWAAKYPSDYQQYTYTDDWRETYDHEIDWTMGKFDKMLARLVDFVNRNPDYELWIASSMGQAATRADNQIQSQLYLTDLPKFMARMGFGQADYSERPAMLPRVIVALKDPARAEEFARKTGNIQFGDRGNLLSKNLGKGVFQLSTPLLHDPDFRDCAIDGQPVPLEDLGFKYVEIQDESGQNAYHIPQGSLLIYSPREMHTSTADPQPLPTTQVAPMILKNYGVEQPSYMSQP